MGSFSDYRAVKRGEIPKDNSKEPSAITSDTIDSESSDSDCGSDSGGDEGEQDGISAENKLDRKLRQAEQRLRDQALRIIEERQNGPRITSSGLHELAEKQRKRKKKLEKRHAKRREARRKEATAKQDSLMAQTADGGDIFMIDVNPTKSNREKLEAPSDDEAEYQDMEPESAVANRTVRRRLKLIARQKAVIQELLAVPVGSDEKAGEVQRLLDEWTAKFDEKAWARQQKIKNRKQKTTTRLRNRSDRLLETVQRNKGSRSNKPVKKGSISHRG